MFVAAWEPGLNPSMPELTEAPVWLEFRGVPPHFFSEEGFEHIAGMLGHPVHCHPTTINMTNLEVGKVLTIINPSKPLPEAVNVQFATGEIHRVTVSSPWLPPICSHCQEIGHSIRRCPTAPITCITCNSSAHSSEACPSTRIKKWKTQDQEDNKNSRGKQSKVKTKKKRAPAVVAKWVEKMPQSETEYSSVALKDKRKKRQIGVELQSETQIKRGSHSKLVEKGASTSKRSVGSRVPNKKPREEKVSSVSCSSSDSQDLSSPDSSSGDEVISEEETSEEDDTPFTKVLSKKEKRYLRNSSGKNSMSKNH